MKTTNSTLHWTMRIGGALMTLLAVFFLERNVGYGVGDEVFCVVCLVLGLVSFVLSWLPDREAQDEPVLQV